MVENGVGHIYRDNREKWSADQIDFVLSQRARYTPYKVIAARLNHQYSPVAIRKVVLEQKRKRGIAQRHIPISPAVVWNDTRK